MKKTRKALFNAVQFVLGAALVIGLGALVLHLLPEKEAEEGWMRIIPPNDVMALADYDGLIWAGGRNGLYTISPETYVAEAVKPDGKRLRGITGLAVSQDGLWVGHSGGLSFLSDKGWTHVTKADDLPENQVLAVAIGPEGKLWVGTLHGLAVQNGAGWQVYTMANGLASDIASLIVCDQKERMWIANGFSPAGGLSVFEEGQFRAIDQGGWPHRSVNAILEVGEDEYLFGTGFSNRGGLVRYQDWELKEIWDRQDGMPGEKIRYLFKDSSGDWWVGSESDGILLWTDNGRIVFNPENGLEGWEVKAMLETEAGEIWLGTEYGLSVLLSEKLQELKDGLGTDG